MLRTQSGPLFHTTMSAHLSAASPSALRAASARERVERLADDGRVDWLDAARASPHLARFGIAAQDDDGIVTARLRLRGASWLVAAQDERFLGGSVGAAHGDALCALLRRARGERPAGVLLCMASGGVRLHEANAAELALARALRELVALRADGVRVDALAVGDVFGGASVLAAAADRLGAVPGVRLGLSGPKVVEATRGVAELDARDAAAVDALYGAAARIRAGVVEPVADDAACVADWLGHAAPRPFADATMRTQALLAPLAAPVDARALPDGWDGESLGGGLWRVARGAGAAQVQDVLVVAPWGARAVDAASLAALDAALLEHVGAAPGGPTLLVLLEDSRGHAVSRAAERAFLSRSLAHHACVLELLRRRGVRIAGVLMGVGHSAAFFANGLQADVLAATAEARVVAMGPAAIARVTRVPAAELVENDAMLGHPVRHFAALGGVARMLGDATPATVLQFAAAAL